MKQEIIKYELNEVVKFINAITTWEEFTMLFGLSEYVAPNLFEEVIKKIEVYDEKYLIALTSELLVNVYIMMSKNTIKLNEKMVTPFQQGLDNIILTNTIVGMRRIIRFESKVSYDKVSSTQKEQIKVVLKDVESPIRSANKISDISMATSKCLSLAKLREVDLTRNEIIKAISDIGEGKSKNIGSSTIAAFGLESDFEDGYKDFDIVKAFFMNSYTLDFSIIKDSLIHKYYELISLFKKGGGEDETRSN